MSRVQISLPEVAVGQLRTIAARTGEPASRVAARLVLSALAGNEGDRRPPVATARATEPPKPTRERRRPPWLRPWDEDEDEERIWRLEMWASIAAMCQRYPTMLGGLSEHWWQDRRLVEWLSALATWRINIDAAAEDPREEISFHNALQQLARIIERPPGSASRFNPDSPVPPEWSG